MNISPETIRKEAEKIRTQINDAHMYEMKEKALKSLNDMVDNLGGYNDSAESWLDPALDKLRGSKYSGVIVVSAFALVFVAGVVAGMNF